MPEESSRGSVMDTEDLLSGLETVLPASTRLAVIHSSFAELAPPSGLDKWATLRAIHTLVQRGIDYNLQRWPDSGIQIGAQSYLRQFYTSLGFTAVGQEYDEDGIMHTHMLYVRPPAGR